jgi:hypothetical protein
MDEPARGDGRGKAEGSRQTQFQPGRSGNPSGLPKANTDPPSVSPGSVDMLAELDGILTRPKAEDRTELQRNLRKVYETDFPGFMRLRDREADRRQKAGAEGKPDPTSGERDEGTENAMAVATAWLQAIRAQMDVHEQISEAIADRWRELSPERQRAILDTAGVPYVVEEGAISLRMVRDRLR